MSDKDEVVCECGHEIHNGKCQYWEHKPNHKDCYYCPCEQFTDTRLAALRTENTELRDKVCGLEAEVNEGGWMDKYNEKCRRVKELHAENRELSTQVYDAVVVLRKIREAAMVHPEAHLNNDWVLAITDEVLNS